MLYVMDASALLALMQGERGGDVVDQLIVENECVASSVNIVEVGTRLVDKGLAPVHLARTLKELDVQTIDFDLEQALLSRCLSFHYLIPTTIFIHNKNKLNNK